MLEQFIFLCLDQEGTAAVIELMEICFAKEGIVCYAESLIPILLLLKTDQLLIYVCVWFVCMICI